jgi:hypothetical protein
MGVMKYPWLPVIAILLSAGAADIADAMTYKDIVLHDKAGVQFFDGPGRREAAYVHGQRIRREDVVGDVTAP